MFVHQEQTIYLEQFFFVCHGFLPPDGLFVCWDHCRDLMQRAEMAQSTFLSFSQHPMSKWHISFPDFKFKILLDNFINLILGYAQPIFHYPHQA